MADEKVFTLNDFSAGVSKIVDNLISVDVTATLVAANWTASGDDYVYELSLEVPVKYHTLVVGLAPTATTAQSATAAAAKITTVTYDNVTNKLSIVATGIVPEIDIPIVIQESTVNSVVEAPKYVEGDVPIATPTVLGVSKPDGTTITVDENGVLSANSGHTIVDENDTAYTKRSNLKFKGATIEDDPTNDATVITVSGDAPVSYKTYTIELDLTNPDPDTWCTRTEGTVTEVSVSGGENEIDEFMGYYPCMLSEGVEGVKLNPNNYAQDIDGASVDITSGSAGDVMVKFPARGYMISKQGDTLIVSITDEPSKAGYKYPTYKGVSVEAVYHSAYEGYTVNNKLRSLSDKAPTASQTIGTFRTQAQANGTGYEQRTFNELTYLQCCALIKYKGKNMQIALGRGFVDDNSAAATTGGTNTYGLNYGETTGKVQMKLFGIEDFWGNVFDCVDGIFSNANRQIQVADGNFNDTGSGYTTVGASFSSNISGYLKDVIGTNDGGFAPASQTYGSATTYFCDDAYVDDSRVAAFGGGWIYADHAGLFRLSVSRAASYANADYGSRITYFKIAEAPKDYATQDMLATVESGSTASKAYAVGDHFIRDNAFCTAISAIAQGGSFTLNTNYTAGDVGSILTELKNGLYVEVTPDGTSTWSQKLNELFSLIDTSKITRNAHAITHKSNGADVCYALALYDNTVIQLQAMWSGANRIDFANFYLRTNGSISSNATIQNAAPTYNDVSSAVCNRTIRFYYN